MRGFAPLAMVCLTVLCACESFFAEPAEPTMRLGIRIAPSMLTRTDTLKHSDNGTVNVLSGRDTLKKEDFQFTPGSNVVKLQVELPATVSATEVTVEVQLRRGKDLLFTGKQNVALKRGVTQTVEVPVEVVDYCLIAQPYVLGSTVTGNLVADRDCQFLVSRRIRQTWELTLAAPTLFEMRMTSADFAPFLGTFLPPPSIAQLTGRSRATTGTLVDEALFPAGRYWLAATHTVTGQAVEGAYTLATSTVTEPQSGRTFNTFVTFGSTANGRITSTDRDDELGAGTNWYDGYTIALQPGETVAATVRADFPVALTRWGASLEEGVFSIPAGQQRTITYTRAATAGSFHSFYVVADRDRTTGSYTITFDRGSPASMPSIVLKSLTTPAGGPVSPSDLRGQVVVTYTATVPPGSAVTQFSALLNLVLACGQSISATQTGTFDVQCPITTTQYANGSYQLDGRLQTSSNSFVSSGFTTVRINN